MPRRAASGIKYLIKRHHGCANTRRPTRCKCQWSGGPYRGHEVVLSRWANRVIDPHSTADAEIVLRRFLKSVDDHIFDPAGEQPAGESDDTLRAFIEEWITHVAKERKMTATSLYPMLNVLKASRLGALSLKALVTASQEIEKWLNATAKIRNWKNKTWNEYHNLLHRVLKQAVKWEKISANPMAKIDRRVNIKPEHFKTRHLLEDVEERLFAVVDQLNRPQHRPNRTKLTYEKAEAIRAALTAGQQGTVVANRYGVSQAVVSAIKHGDTWNPERLRPGTRGTEMRRRLIGAFDGGLRAGEMQLLQLEHVNWRPVSFIRADGTRGQGYEILLPPEITKGGKTTGQTQIVFAATPRFVQMLEARRFQLKNNKPSKTFIWGTEDGSRQKGFKRGWQELFTLAGLDWGRDKGLVWHTVRHEFISRIAEDTKDPVLTQEIARHRNLETTQGYFHVRRDRRYAAVAGR